MFNEDDIEEIENENQQSSNSDYINQEPVIEEIEDTEKETGTEETIESDKVSNKSIKVSYKNAKFINFILQS